ncbi:MAG: amino acid ABC transporter ATP-binding protein [Deltaproteobacteria bacterium]|jgi:ABC-type polar amino acid transport system ATPase subunit|nr:MAG: amino acid ABC transporter ATP-binding protein [Deltaproteobacteria bacterium]
MIEVQNVSFTYPDGSPALRDVSLSCPPEHIFAIMGFSGSGKTTLLNCIARFLHPQSGCILLDGQDIAGMEARVFRRQVGVIFQHLNLFPHLNVLENMTLAPRRVQDRPETDARAEAMEMLERLRIADLALSYPSQVSGGQAQRVAIARGLILKPRVMLLDEPTSALDAKTTMEFAQWLRELQSDTGFIIVTHDLPFAEETAEKGVFMEAGKVREEGHIRDLLQHSTGDRPHV